MTNYCVVEAITYKAIVERNEAQDAAAKEAKTKQQTRGEGLKQFAQGGS